MSIKSSHLVRAFNASTIEVEDDKWHQVVIPLSPMYIKTNIRV